MRREVALLLTALFGFTSLVNGSCSVSATQSLSNQWNDGTDNYYQYYITVTNTGSEQTQALVSMQTPASGIAINVAQSWNLEELASTDETGHTAIFAVKNIINGANNQQDVEAVVLEPGASWTSSGYIVKGAQTTITAGTLGCGSSSSSSSTPSSSSAESSSSAPASSSAESSSASSSACQFSASLSTVTAGASWTDSSYKYTQFQLSISNTGSEVLKTAQTFIYFNAGNSASFPGGVFGTINQAWNMQVVPETEGAIGYAPGSVYAVNVFDLQVGQSFNGAGFIFKVPLANLANEADYDYPFGASSFQALC